MNYGVKIESIRRNSSKIIGGGKEGLPLEFLF